MVARADNDALWELACELDFPISLHDNTAISVSTLLKDNKDSQSGHAQLGKQRLRCALDPLWDFLSIKRLLSLLIFTWYSERFPKRLGLWIQLRLVAVLARPYVLIPMGATV